MFYDGQCETLHEGGRSELTLLYFFPHRTIDCRTDGLLIIIDDLLLLRTRDHCILLEDVVLVRLILEVLVLLLLVRLGLISLKLPTLKLGPVLDLKLRLVLLRLPCGLGLIVLRKICLDPGPPKLGPIPLLSTRCVLLVAAKSL